MIKNRPVVVEPAQSLTYTIYSESIRSYLAAINGLMVIDRPVLPVIPMKISGTEQWSSFCRLYEAKYR
jgi:hypothetical protein